MVRPEYSRPALRACVAWQFWLDALSNKGGRGQRNREEIGFYFFIFSRGFAARFGALRARISRLRRSCTRLYKAAMLRRLVHKQDVLRRFHFQCPLLHRISSYRTFRASNLTRRVSFCWRSFDTFCANVCLFWFKLKSLFEVFNSSLTA